MYLQEHTHTHTHTHTYTVTDIIVIDPFLPSQSSIYIVSESHRNSFFSFPLPFSNKSSMMIG